MHPTIETPSGKNENTENFPVAKLVAKKYQKHVVAFYLFARAADDISDNPKLSPDDKIARLDKFGEALVDKNDNSVESVIPLRDSLKETDVTPQHALDLLVAFKRDVTKLRYNNWEELLDYCRYSASPVGRYLLDLHGEDKSTWPANDAMCSILQITNHLQDCADDYRELDRVYIPLDTFKAHGAQIQELAAPKSSKELRACMDEVIIKMAPMMTEALTFTNQVNDTRLRIDVAVINNVALKLIQVLSKNDPLCDNVKLSKLQKISCLVQGTGRALFL